MLLPGVLACMYIIPCKKYVDFSAFCWTLSLCVGDVVIIWSL